VIQEEREHVVVLRGERLDRAMVDPMIAVRRSGSVPAR
jgi:hypothetical protein